MVTICTTTFNIQQFYLLTIQGIYVFCMDLRRNLELLNIILAVYIVTTRL